MHDAAQMAPHRDIVAPGYSGSKSSGLSSLETAAGSKSDSEGGGDSGSDSEGGGDSGSDSEGGRP